LLDGDGLWRRTFGERRSKDRRGDDKEDAAIIHLPFLDELFEDKEAPSTDGDTGKVNENKSDMTTDSDSDSNRTKASSDSPKKLTDQEQARLLSLRNMLDASNARYEQASKKRRPVFAAGLKVRITEGEHMGGTGVVLDADYIESRALVSLPDQNSPIWFGFRLLGNC